MRLRRDMAHCRTVLHRPSIRHSWAPLTMPGWRTTSLSELLLRMEAVHVRISALDPGAEGQGRISATLNAMPDSEAAGIASEMIEVAYRIWREGNRSGIYWWWTDDG